jgi:signal transduction histidine kinase
MGQALDRGAGQRNATAWGMAVVGFALLLALATAIASPALLVADPTWHAHGASWGWQPLVTWLMVTTNLLIGFSYVVISAALVYLVYKARRSLPYHHLALAFGTFIGACGVGHLVSVVVLYYPLHALHAYVHVITAVASVVTAVAVPPLIPRMLRLIHLYDRERNGLRRAKQRAEDRLRLLAKAGHSLLEARTVRDRLRTLCDLVVPELADWCIVDLRLGAGPIERMAVRGPSSAEEAWARQMGELLMPDASEPGGVAEVIGSGRPLFAPVISRAMAEVYLKRLSPGRAQAVRTVMERTRMASLIVVPLVAEGQPYGALSLIRADGSPQYTDGDLAVAEALAGRAALAIENARLLEAAQAELRQREYTEAQLIQAQKMEAIGRLAGGVAHDFNNLLTVITGNVELAVQVLEADAHELRSDLDQVLQASRRAGNLTRQLLAFARRAVIEPQTISLNDLVINLDRMIRRLIGADVELVVLPASCEALVCVDPGQIEQVILNLVVNARDAMPQGGTIRMEVDCADLDHDMVGLKLGVQPGRYVVLTIADTGHGMPPEVAAHAFDPFFTTKATGKGSGLGLSTSYGIVKQHQGNIWLYSEIDHGTTVRVYLPQASGPVTVMPADEGMTGVSGGTETVLLVEDEPALRELLARILRGHGYTVLEAGNGEEAIRITRTHRGPLDLVITDVIMPQMGGHELGVALRGTARLLFMSGYTEDGVVRLGHLDHGVAFLQKPFPPQALLRRVREVLDQ